MGEYLFEEEIRERLVEYINHYQTQKAAAEDMGISAQYLSDMLAGNRHVGEQVAYKLGFIRVYMFRRKLEGE